jgi:hypothetical protein
MVLPFSYGAAGECTLMGIDRLSFSSRLLSRGFRQRSLGALMNALVSQPGVLIRRAWREIGAARRHNQVETSLGF